MYNINTLPRATGPWEWLDLTHFPLDREELFTYIVSYEKKKSRIFFFIQVAFPGDIAHGHPRSLQFKITVSLSFLVIT